MNWSNDVRAEDLPDGSYLCDNDIDMRIVEVCDALWQGSRPTASAFGCYRCSRIDSIPVDQEFCFRYNFYSNRKQFNRINQLL